MRRATSLLRATAALAVVSLTSCAPSYAPSEFRHEVSLQITDAQGSHDRLIATIDSATRTLDVAFPTIDDTALSDAIVRAQDRGVAVRAITDIDAADTAGAVALAAANVPLQLADGEVTYFEFSISQDAIFTSDRVRMTHAWALADREHATVADFAGNLDDGTRLVFEIRGEDVLEDLWTEHNQVFGGEDATSTTAYDNLAKSIADFRWEYPTQSDVRLQLWFGPQERLTKRMIDAVYSAKSSIWISSGWVTNEGLSRILQWKARDGLDVRVVVGPSQPAQYLPNSAADLFVNRTPDVGKHQVTDTHVPTMMIIDADRARDGHDYTASVYVLSHELIHARRFPDQPELTPDLIAVGLETDQLTDGDLWVMDNWGRPLNPDVQSAIDTFEGLYTAGGSL